MFRMLHILIQFFVFLNLKMYSHLCLLKSPRRVCALSFRLWGHLICGIRGERSKIPIITSDGYLIPSYL